MDELISKQAAIEAINLWLYCDKDERMPADVIKALPPVYVPEMNVGDMIYRQAALDKCKADANCPEIPDSWIPVKAHPATDEEQESSPDIDYWFDCEMPDDEQEILVTVKHKNWLSVEKDVCYVDSCYGLDSGYDWLDDIIAWMPLPEPWKGEQNGQTD